MTWNASVIEESPELSELCQRLRGERWTLVEGEGPIIAVALHDGHRVREDVLSRMVISESDRLREEDPHTAKWTTLAPTRLIAHHSRFEIDQNRPRERAIYRTPAESWGLHVWSDIPEKMAETSISYYNAFYLELTQLIQRKLKQHPYLFVYDMHTYNHHRMGPDAPFDPVEKNPEINIGTAISKFDHERFGPVLQHIRSHLQGFDFFGRQLDVRDNIRFQGGYLPFWLHTHFPNRVGAIQFEIKKFFMNEWTGVADESKINKLKDAFETSVPGVMTLLEQMS